MINIYKEIAKKHNTTEEDVRREIQYAINEAYDSKEKSNEVDKFQKSILANDRIPSSDEFIKFVVKEVKKELKTNR